MVKISLCIYRYNLNLITQNNDETRFEVMYTLKYPDDISLENPEVCYAETLSNKKEYVLMLLGSFAR